MSDPFIGEIIMFGGNFAPRGWAFCNGQLLPIAQNTALFSILGTTYGGDGKTTFALPDLRGRVAISPGQGPGLSNYQLGQAGGTESVTLTTAQIPAHNHLLAANSSAGDQSSPLGNFPAAVNDPGAGSQSNGYSATSNGTMAGTASTPAGGSQPHTNIEPFLCVNFIIALEGIFPSRN
jgi:microcystin-dependent protein